MPVYYMCIIVYIKSTEYLSGLVLSKYYYIVVLQLELLLIKL